MEFHEQPVDEYIQSLVWLTYVQTIIYELDINTEQEGAGANRRSAMRLAEVGAGIEEFLEEHDLSDVRIRQCLRDVIQYLRKERDELHDKIQYSREEIFAILDLKSADLGLLRRIYLRVADLECRESEMAIFRRIDKIRETFDDIRDYFEDLEIANFNTVICLQKLGGDMLGGAKILNDFVEAEMERARSEIALLDAGRRQKFELIFERLLEEKTYFMAELAKLPSN
ncbi:MAG: hypothetical protein AAF604_01840 [Acidobacteriota bacterium]